MKTGYLKILFPILWLTGCGIEPPAAPVIPEDKPPAPTAQPARQGINPQNPEVAAYLQDQVQKQSSALNAAHVVINGAWNYTGFSFLSPDPNAKIPARLIAVDVTVSGQTPFFDVDDMEVVDGVTNFSYGSDPHFAYLDITSGELLPGGVAPAQAPKTNRILLIYGFPKETKTVKIAYWNRILVNDAVTVADTGWEIPHPPAE